MMRFLVVSITTEEVAVVAAYETKEEAEAFVEDMRKDWKDCPELVIYEKH